MDVRNCRTCGKLFNVLNGERICPACQRALEDKFQEVKEYLHQNPNSSVEQTAKDNDLSVKQIKQWIREERLILSSAVESGIVCEKCGKPICTGRFCDICKANMTNDLMQVIDRPVVQQEVQKSGHTKDRMRFL